MGTLAALPTPASSRQDDTADLAAMVEALDTVEVRAHTRFLAAPILAGRGVGTDGARIAAAYIAAQFERAGLVPAGTGGSYLLPVELEAARSTSNLVFGAGRQTVALTPFAEFVAWPTGGDGVRVVDGEVVFVGFGVRDTSYQWDDFGDTPLAGKVLLMMSGDPGLVNPDVFGGSAPSLASGVDAKLEEARRVGAAGVLFVHSPTASGETWSQTVEPWVTDVIRRPSPPGGSLGFAAWITDGAARRVAQFAGIDYEAMVRRAGRPDFTPVRLPLRTAVDMSTETRTITTASVVGRCPGSTVPTDAPVLVTSSYEYLGTGPWADGDAVFPGAARNATAASSLVALAGAFCRPDIKTRRPVYFAAAAGGPGLPQVVPVTGGWHSALVIDEIDLRGSGPSGPLVGIDGVEAVGADALMSRAAQAEAVSVQDAGLPGRPPFFRSPGYALAQAGTPVLMVRGAWDGRPGNLTERYALPSDTVSGEFSYQSAIKQLRVALRLVWHLANAGAPLQWQRSSPFARDVPGTVP